MADMASERDVQLIQDNHPVCRARVSTAAAATLTNCIEVGVNVQVKSWNCPCQCRKEMGMNCHHAKALLLFLGMGVSGKDNEWCSDRHSVQCHKRSHTAETPGMTVAGKLTVDDGFAPPDCKRSAGRPAKKRKDQSHMRKPDTVRRCKACGDTGHFAIACESPSTEFQFGEHLSAAIQWCRKHEKTDCEDVNVQFCS